MEQCTDSKLGNEYVKARYCHPAYFTSMQHTSCKTLGWIKHKLESRLLGEKSIVSDCTRHPHYGRKQRGIKESLDESEKKYALILIQKTKIMASSPSWQIDGGTL